MFTTISSKRFWKVLGWVVVALLINLLMVLSLQTTLLWLDYGGIAFAQTGPPDDTPTPIPTATFTHTPTSIPTATPPPTHTPIPTATTPPQPTSPGGGGGGGGDSGGGSDDDDADEPTATFTPLPFPTDTLPLAATETVVIEDTPEFTPTLTVESIPTTEPIPADEIPTPLPPIDYTLCESIFTEPPPGFPTLAGPGTIYHIIPAPNDVAVQVTTKLGNGVFNFNLAVPSSPAHCKVAEIDQDPVFILEPPAPVPESIKLLVPFNIDIFGVDSNQNVTKITSHSPPLVFTIGPLDVSDEDAVVLLRYDEVEQQYRLPQQEYDPTTKTLTAFLSQTSFFILGTLAGQPTSPFPDSEQVAPTPLPASQAPVTSPETKDDLLPLWLFLGILAGLIGITTLFLLLGGGRALKEMLSGTLPHPMAERDPETGGLALSFTSEMPDVDPLIRVTLASLPTAIPAQTLLPQTSSSTRLNLPPIGVNASIRAIERGMMPLHHAVTVPDEVNLVGWNEAGLGPGKFSYNVRAGHLNWYGADEIFARLHELEPGDVIEVHDQTNIHHQYFVDQVQSYQGDTASAVEISPPTAGDQLVLIAWGEAYDVDQQEYRDYIVIQTHMGDVPLVNRFDMLKADTF